MRFCRLGSLLLRLFLFFRLLLRNFALTLLGVGYFLVVSLDLGRPVGSFWGNASTWALNARAAGFVVDNTPEVGAIAQWNAFAGDSGYAGHVGIVESVNSNGTITISEMNNGSYGGFNIVNSRTLNPESVSNFIH